mgnify:FL=1
METNLNFTNNSHYYILNDSLNKLLLNYWNYLKTNLDKNLFSKKNYDLIIELISNLQLLDYIKNIKILYENNIPGGLYNYEKRILIINVGHLITAYKLGFISDESFLVEYYTILFHEIFHAIQYKCMYNDNKSLIALAKKLSLQFKKSNCYNKNAHYFIPDEREANIESSKLLNDFYLKNFYLNKQAISIAKDNLNYYLALGYQNNFYPLKILNNFTSIFLDFSSQQIDLDNKILYGLKTSIVPNTNIFRKIGF